MTEFKERSNYCEEAVGNYIISAFTMPKTPGDNILSFVRKFQLHNYHTMKFNVHQSPTFTFRISMIGLDLKLERDLESQSVSGCTKY